MVWICDECKRDCHNRCTNTISCDCKCNVGNAADVVQKGSAIIGGVTAAVGGLALTICTGGLAAVVIGGALLGAGVSSTWQGVEKSIKGERIDGTSYVTDVAVGAITGAATGGIGAGGEAVATNVVKEGAKIGVKKFAVRTVTGAAIGVTSKTIDEVKQCSTTDKKWTDFGKNLDENGEERGTATAWIMGATVGALGGAASHVSSNISKEVSSGIGKAVTRVTISGTTAAVSDATVQGVNILAGNQEEYNVKQTLTCATTSVIMTTAQESIKGAIYEVNGGKNRVLIKRTVPNDKVQAALNAYDDMNNIPDSTRMEAKDVAELRTHWNENIELKNNEIKEIRQEIKNADSSMRQAKSDGDIATVQQQQIHKDNLKVKLHMAETTLRNSQAAFSQDFPRQFMGDQNAHYLDRD